METIYLTVDLKKKQDRQHITRKQAQKRNRMYMMTLLFLFIFGIGFGIYGMIQSTANETQNNEEEFKITLFRIKATEYRNIPVYMANIPDEEDLTDDTVHTQTQESVPEPTPEPTVEPTPEPTPEVATFTYNSHIPLPENIQKLIWDLCDINDEIDYPLILGLIEEECDFDPTQVSSVGAYGYMQLHPKYFPSNLSHEDNIRHGVDYLIKQIRKYNDIAAALTAYNAGHDTGNRLYANLVLGYAAQWEQKLGIESE